MSHWDFQMKGEKSAEVYIYELIGEGWGLSARDFQKEMAQLGDLDELSIRINSMGGSVFEGFTIFEMLRNSPAKVVVNIDGIAASIASVIAMAGDEINIAENGFVMIHRPWTITMGDDDDHEERANQLRKLGKQGVSIYAKKTGKSEEEIAAMLKPETWLNAEEAVDMGFADAISEPSKAAALVIDRELYPNAPEILQHKPIRGEASEKIDQAKAEKQAEEIAIRLRLLEVEAS